MFSLRLQNANLNTVLRMKISGISLLAAALELFVPVCVNFQPLQLPNDQTTQAEPTIAVWNEVVLIAFVDTSHYNPFRAGFSSLIGYARSVDGGLNFQDMGPVSPCLWCFGLSNPVLAVSPSGVFYLCSLQDAQGLRIGVARSEDKGLTFNRPVLVPKVGTLPDLPHIAVDPLTGRIYVAWVDLMSWQLFVAVSEDGGRSFLQPIEVGTRGISSKHCARLAIGKDSRVYVFWIEGSAILGSISSDYGRSWSQPRALISQDSIYLAWRLPGHDCVLIPPLPNPAVDPLSGCIHLVFHGLSNAFPLGVFHMAVDPDLNVVIFPKPLEHNSSMAKERFMPALAVTPNGVIGVAFYELEEGQLRVVLVISANGGQDFAKKFVSDPFVFPPSYDPLRRPCYIGDYIALTADSRAFYLAWAATYNLVKTPGYPNGRPDLDVFFIKVPVA